MLQCLFCDSAGPFRTIEHIIPESLGNDDLLLEGQVCDGCQNYFGKEVERFVLEKTPIAAWRVILGTKTKKGRRPKVDLSQPALQRGRLPARSRFHDDLAFEANEDESVRITKIAPGLYDLVETGARSDFRLVMTPLVLFMLGRFLCKVGLELVCTVDPIVARSPRFDGARRYARLGQINPLWPILWYRAGSIELLKTWKRDATGDVVESECYTYWLADVGGYRVFEFGIGTDRFVVALDDVLCPLLLRTQVAYPECRVLWYPPESLKRGCEGSH